MASWIISIVGVVFLGILLDLIYPNGKTNKLCKSIFGLIVLVVIIKPIFNMKIEFDNKNFVDKYLEESFNESRLNLVISEIEKALLLQGIDGVFVEIESNIIDNNISIEKVSIDISNAVLLKNFENINKYEVIVEEVKKIVNIEEEKVIIYG